MKKWLPEELGEIPCDFCGAREIAKQFIRKDGMRVGECAQCGLAYLNPRPKPEFITRFYDPDYFTGVAAERGEGGLKCNLVPTPIEQKINSRVMKIIDEKFGGFEEKDVIEIGCATGDLLIQMKDAGARVKGLEISDFAARYARKRGLDVKTVTIDDFASKNPESFDILFALEVIEHVLSPTQFMKFSAQLLRPKGLLVLSTPNYRCAKRFGNEWFGFNASFEHIYFFSIEILKEMGMQTMMELEYWETSTYSGGPIGSESFFGRKIRQILDFCFVVKNVGSYHIVKNVHRGLSSCNKFGIGHTMFAIFKKKL